MAKLTFDRFYVCFAGLADGWKAGCRKIIALDGCFLKSPNQGEILTAIGRDGNNHIYPVACSVVRSGSEGFTVDEGKKTCTCRMWQLSRLPCVHAIKLIFLINRVPESYVLAWFETEMYFVAYHNYVTPVPGMNLWPNQSRPRKNQSVDDSDDVDVVLRVQVRDERASESRGGATGSRGRRGAAMSRGGASGSRGGAGVSRRVDGGSRGGSSVFGDANRSIGRGASRSGSAHGSRGRSASRSGGASGSRGRGAGGSKRKPLSIGRTQKR
uniref:Multidrug resistance-associated protein 5 n=1 Tax=Tanacetum cinerariifolium TaxID=118510 RepID=A0A699J907_TANCI|nr:multidrug resistance-associated protein 5 [Tanacetum cinerariifolium]